MKRFLIKNALYLQSAKKLLDQNTYFATEVEEEQKELLEVFGECVEELSSAPKEVRVENLDEKPVDPTDDITLAKGVGKALTVKLAEAGIVTFSGLKAAMTEKTDEMKELLGVSFDKVMANFTSQDPQ